MSSRGAGRERRRIDRKEGQHLLFAGAQDDARQEGLLKDGRNACFEQSVLGRGAYTLRTASGELITRVPLVQAREMLRFRRAVARRLLSDLKQDVLKESTADVERRQIRVQPEQLRALAWAIGSGRRFPYEEGVRKKKMISVLLLFCCVVPGVIYYMNQVAKPHSQYQSNLKKLLARWHREGKPDPPASFFVLFDL
jgi:hypothetical protein